ncbi:MAG TPA: orotidine-5'-phosphate decarboxylase [Ruminiclostridium sp.]|nr:orotidine-5'-phosphate decarboxylase [Ruminiclostridium sp.]
MSLDLLIKKIKQLENPTVAGLDPDFGKIPQYIKDQAVSEYGETLEAAADAICKFNFGLIDALCDIVPAVKPQCAYYEKYGWQGMRALAKTIEYAKSKGMFVITDGKRNDIGTTMEAYAAAHLGSVSVNSKGTEPFGADALTVNGYLGSDGIMPLIKICKENNKGIFVLVKTSNPSSGELQDKKLENGKEIYEYMGEMCEKWGEELTGGFGYSGVGAVVGATYPEQLSKLRKKLPHTFFLVPGYGAQGGGAKDVAGGFDKDGLGAIINASRSIMYAYKKEGSPETDYAAASRREAIRMKKDILSNI